MKRLDAQESGSKHGRRMSGDTPAFYQEQPATRPDNRQREEGFEIKALSKVRARRFGLQHIPENH